MRAPPLLRAPLAPARLLLPGTDREEAPGDEQLVRCVRWVRCVDEADRAVDRQVLPGDRPDEAAAAAAAAEAAAEEAAEGSGGGLVAPPWAEEGSKGPLRAGEAPRERAALPAREELP